LVSKTSAATTTKKRNYSFWLLNFTRIQS